MRHDPDLYSSDIEWLLTESDAALGYRSSLGSQIDTLLRGGSSGGYDVACADPYRDDQIGSIGQPGSATKHRRIWPVWIALPTIHKEILSARYTAHFRIQTKTRDGGYGWTAWPLGVMMMLGDLAGVVLLLARDADSLETVLTACAKCDTVALRPWLERATDASRAAHRAYREQQTYQWEIGEAAIGLAYG
jgi:hypothetical protein